MRKDVISIILALAMLSPIGSISAFANENANPLVTHDNQNLTELDDAEFFKRYGMTKDELLNFDENVTNALNKLNITRSNTDGSLTIPVSENIYLEISTKEEVEQSIEKAVVYNRTITGTMSFKTIYDVTVLEVNSIGVFRTDGTRSTPIDAYCTYDSWVWNVTSTSSYLGSPSYNAFVRNSFSSQVNIGIEPVNMVIKTISKSSVIYCNANGVYSVNWS